MGCNSLKTELSDRIRFCVERVGRQVDFIKKSGISRSQLNRYLDGKSEPSFGKLSEIARISGVNISWLMNGEGESIQNKEGQVLYDIALLEHTIKTFEEALLERRGRALTPFEKSLALPLISAEMEHEKKIGIGNGKVDKFDMIDIVDYISLISPSDTLGAFQKSALDMMQSGNDLDDEWALGNFAHVVSKTTASHFSSYLAEGYISRTRNIISDLSHKHLNRAIETLFVHNKKNKIKMLDLGCGTGRYMSYIHQNYERIQVNGIDSAPLMVRECQNLQDSGQLPKGSVKQALAQNIPYEDESFDFLFSTAMLHWIPYFLNSHYGVKQVFSEANRILKMKGTFYFSMRCSEGERFREYVPFNQVLSRLDIEKILKEYGFEIVWAYTPNDAPFSELKGAFDVSRPSRYQDFIRVFARKI